MSKGHKLVGVEKHSIAHKLHIKAGDRLICVNGENIRDIFDYQFLATDENVSLVIEKANGKIKEFTVTKDMGEDLGLRFESSLMDSYQSCSNKCIFCFIDQNPPGMRDTIYFKDDDSRLSFLQGNYITLTNMKEADIDRIIRYRMEPINISVHTTNPELRCRMLNNRFAGDVLRYIPKLCDAGIKINAQIVLCKDYNDGEELQKTLTDLTEFYPSMQSVAVVPVGLTKFREGLTELKPIEKEDALAAIAVIEKIQLEMYEKYGTHFCHASDELYLTAGMNMPEEERYDGYPQIENGVGMIRSQYEEFMNEMDAFGAEDISCSGRHATIVTGVSGASYIEQYAGLFNKKYGAGICTETIVNHFFGERITVTGLICGCDLIEQLKGKDLGDELLLPLCTLRSGENYFLDDVTVSQVEKELGVKVTFVPAPGDALFRAFAGLENTDLRRQIYEQADSGNSREA